MTNLFPLPYWAPALKRVPIPPLREEMVINQLVVMPKI